MSRGNDVKQKDADQEDLHLGGQEEMVSQTTNRQEHGFVPAAREFIVVHLDLLDNICPHSLI